MTEALLLIDIQNDYFPGGAAVLVRPDEAAQNAHTALTHYRSAGLPVIHIQHINDRPGATFFLPDTPGVELHRLVTPIDDEPVIVKHTPDSFYSTTLLHTLRSRNVSRITVVGMMTHMCVDTTVRAAKTHALPVTLLHDACATKDLTFHGHTIPADQVQCAFMASLGGMFATVMDTETLLGR